MYLKYPSGYRKVVEPSDNRKHCNVDEHNVTFIFMNRFLRHYVT